MEKKLMELCEAAKRATEAAITTEGDLEEARCIDALNQLNNFSISCQLLVSTQVVNCLLPLTKHPRKKIQDFASELVASWRNMFLEQMKRDEQQRTYPISSEVQPANAKVRKVDRTTFGKLEKISDFEIIKARKIDQIGSLCSKKLATSRCVKLEENNSVEKAEEKQVSDIDPQKKLSSMIKCNDCMRETVREKLYNALSKVSSEAQASKEIQDQINRCNPIGVAISLECAMFEKWGRCNGTYYKYKAVMGNLKDPRNPDFRRKVLLGQVKPETVVNLTVEEMASDRKQCYYQHLEKERARTKERHRILFGNDPREKNTIIRLECGRCGHKGISYKEWFRDGGQNLIRRHLTCLNCYQYWLSTTHLGGVLPI